MINLKTINGTTIGHTGDTDLLILTLRVLTVAGELDANINYYLITS